MQAINVVQYSRPPTATSPYAQHYRTPMCSEHRTLIAERQHVAKWPRADLEDKYLRQLDEHYALKKENTANHDKIRKLVTRILRLTGQSFAGVAAKRNGTPESNGEDTPAQMDCLQLRLVDLESHNAQLRDRLRAMIDQQQRLVGGGGGSSNPSTHRSRCASAAGQRRGSSASSHRMQSKQSAYKSQESLLSHIDEPTSDKPSARQQSLVNNNITEPANMAVDERELNELKIIVQRLQEQLKEHAVDEECKNCTELRATQAELKRVQRDAKRRIAEVEQTMAENADKWQSEIGAYRLKIEDLSDRLEREIVINQTLTAAKATIAQDLRAAQQANDDLQELQDENASLKRYRENIAQLATELARRTADMRAQHAENAALRTELDECRQQLKHAEGVHEERMARQRALQDGHDELAVQLEGVRAQVACLEAYNRQLEAENRRIMLLQGTTEATREEFV